jgi:hypothetical protein
MTEEWREIKGCKPGWLLSNLGRATSSSGAQLKINTASGYESYSVVLSDNKRRQRSLTRLMRENFPYEWIKDLEEGEESKPVSGHPGFYVTNRGRVWSDWRWRWSSPWRCKNPPGYYWNVSIGSRPNITNINLHTLVGRHFLSDWQEGLLVCHHRETLSYPEINFADNLFAGTYVDNNRDSVSKGRASGNTNRDSGGKFI